MIYSMLTLRKLCHTVLAQTPDPPSYNSVSYNGKRKYQDVRDYSNILEPQIYSTVYKLEDFQGFTERPGGEPSVVTTVDRDVYLSTRSLVASSAASTDAADDGTTQASASTSTTATTGPTQS